MESAPDEHECGPNCPDHVPPFDCEGRKMSVKRRLTAGKGFWYMQHIEECVLCGRSETLRERMPPPALPKRDRYSFKQTACCQHFI